MTELAINLLATIIAGTSVWLAQRIYRFRTLARRQAFFGLGAKSAAVISVSRHAASTLPQSVERQDLAAVVDVAVLIRDCGAVPDIVAPDGGGHGVGRATEFCIGGPHSNKRTATHLKSLVRGVRIEPYEADKEGLTIHVGPKAFRRVRGSEEFVLIARIVSARPRLPLWLICGQTARSNHAATRYLATEHPLLSRTYGSDKSFCIALRLIEPDVYGIDQIELIADVTVEAFQERANGNAGARSSLDSP